MTTLSRGEKLALVGAIICFIGALLNYANIECMNSLFVTVIAVIEIVAIIIGVNEHYTIK